MHNVLDAIFQIYLIYRAGAVPNITLAISITLYPS